MGKKARKDRARLAATAKSREEIVRSQLAAAAAHLRRTPDNQPDELSRPIEHEIADGLDRLLEGEPGPVAFGLERKKKRGRPRLEKTAALAATIYDLRTQGMTWDAIGVDPRVKHDRNDCQVLYKRHCEVVALIEELRPSLD